MITVRKLLGATGGATAVEFALTAPMFMALLWGIIEAGLALWTQFGMENGVEEAARCASVYYGSTCSTASAITSYAASHTLGATIPASAFTYSKPSCGNQVNGSYNYAFFTHYLGTRVTLSAQSCFPNINAGG